MGRRLGGQHGGLAAVRGEEPEDVPLDAEVVRGHPEHPAQVAACRSHELAGLVRLGRGNALREVGPLHPGLLADARQEGVGVEVTG